MSLKITLLKLLSYLPRANELSVLSGSGTKTDDFTSLDSYFPASIQDNDSDEDDFEEVPEKEGYEPYLPEHLREEAGLVPRPTKPVTSRHWHILGDPSDRKTVESDPLTYAANLKLLQGKDGRSGLPKFCLYWDDNFCTSSREWDGGHKNGIICPFICHTFWFLHIFVKSIYQIDLNLIDAFIMGLP